MCAPFVTIAHSTSTTSTTIPSTNMPTSTTTPTTATGKPTSTSSSPSIHMYSSYPLGISDELLCELYKVQVNGLFCH